MELIVLGLVAGVSFLSYALWKRSRTEGLAQALPKERAVALLDSGETNFSALRPGDVVTHLMTDYIVEGAVTLDDDGRVTRLYKLADAGKVRWLGVRPGEQEPLVLDQITRPDGMLPAAMHVPEHLVLAGVPYRLAARVSARVRRAGNLGMLGVSPGSPPPVENASERAWLYDYAGAGAQRILALSWNEHTEAFVGEPVPRTMLQVLPA